MTAKAPSPVIYLDHNATTPVDPRVLEAMLPYFRDSFGNAASAHALGCAAHTAVERAREQAASLIGADPREIIWTSGATESDNLAIKGVAEFYKDKGRHIITAVHEHHAVLDPCRKLAASGFEVTWLKPEAGSGGRITGAQVAQALRDDTILVSIMWANNEVGTLNEVNAIGAACRAKGVLFHTDATQATGKVVVNVEEAQVDLLSASAHKFHGPKGVGFLYVKRKGPRVRLEPIFDGGGHERGMRSGTLNVPGIVGLGVAAEICRSVLPTELPHLTALRDQFESLLQVAIPGMQINGNREYRLPQTSHISIPGIDSDRVIASLDDLAISAGAACTSASREVSHVLRAIGLNEQASRGSMRVSLGRFTTSDEVHRAEQRLAQAVKNQQQVANSCEA